MKFFLALIVFCSFSLAQAQVSSSVIDPGNLWYQLENTTCSNGESTVEHPISEFKFQIVEDLSTLIQEVQSADGDAIEQVRFTLNLVGKNTYLAIPEDIQSDHEYFFVTIDVEDLTHFSIYYSDSMGAQCGGGMIVHNIVIQSTIQAQNSISFSHLF